MQNSFCYKRFSAKGFIGPIGDDLPSLVPIVAALLLFFSIFALTLNTYETKNDEIRKQTDMTSVSRELKGDSLILDVTQFSQKCQDIQLKKFPYSFMAGIYGTDVDITHVTEDFSLASANAGDPVALQSYVNSDDARFLKQIMDPSTKQAFFCSYTRVGGKSFSASKKAYLLRFYPVGVQLPKEFTIAGNKETHYLIVPAVMAMVFWE